MILKIDPNVGPKGDAARVTMWRYLFFGLFTLGVIATGGAIYLLAIGKESSPAWVLATAVVTGTIGLFSDSPTTAVNVPDEEENELEPNGLIRQK